MTRKVFCVGALLMLIVGSANGQGPSHTMNNGRIEIGIDSNWGGAITFLGYYGYGLNFVNNGIPDTGRSIQVSLYTMAGRHTRTVGRAMEERGAGIPFRPERCRRVPVM